LTLAVAAKHAAQPVEEAAILGSDSVRLWPPGGGFGGREVVRLIRSKGVGVYFVTQNPLDVPDKVLGKLGNRV
jgi:hypothetical protein